MKETFSAALSKAANRQELTEQDIAVLLAAEQGEEERELFCLSNKVRQEVFGDEVHLRGLIEVSNYCKKDCCYCGLRCSNKAIERYRLTTDEILCSADYAAKLDYGTIVLQSGEDPFFNGERLAEIIYKIKQLGNFAITISAGVLSKREYKQLLESGANRYLMKHETANAELFAKLRPGTTLAERIEHLHLLGQLGFQVGSGFMLGLPGQTGGDQAADILLLKNLKVQMAGIGPFIPHSNTPLGNYQAGSLADTLRTLAVARIVLPRVHLPATTALGTLIADGQQQALQVGANVVMPNLSPSAYRRLYQIYPGKRGNEEQPEGSHQRLVNMLVAIGRVVASGRGDGLTSF